MDYDQLASFLEVARLNSFSRAAEKIYRTQPAISAQVRLLEQECGEKLFDRSGKKVMLTPAGEILKRYAEKILGLQKEALQAIAELNQTPRGKLKIIPGIIRDAIQAREYTRFDRSHFSEYGDFSLNFESVYYVLSRDYNQHMDIQKSIKFGLDQYSSVCIIQTPVNSPGTYKTL